VKEKLLIVCGSNNYSYNIFLFISPGSKNQKILCTRQLNKHEAFVALHNCMVRYFRAGIKYSNRNGL
jgi:hypothetical protein